MINNYSDLGSQDDRVSVWIDGEQVQHYLGYTFRRAILTQPSSFSLKFGSGDLAPKLLAKLRPGLEVSLRVGPTKLFSGVLEDPGTSYQSATEVTGEGRDWLSFLCNNDVADERQLGSPTYFELTRKVMDLCGLEEHALFGDNNAARKAASRVASKVSPPKQAVETVELPRPGNQGAKIQYQTIKCELGQSWFDLLVSQFKRVGLYLWCTGEGDFVLGRPTIPLEPIYRIQDYVGMSRTETNIISGSLTSKTSGRHAHCKVYGRGYPDKKGIRPVHGEWTDNEMLQLGYTNWRVIHDSDASTVQDCEYIAKRILAEERRQNRTLTYTMSGHTTPWIDGNAMAIWTPDTSVFVDSDRLAFPGEEETGIHEVMYIESVEFSRQPQTQTVLRLMRADDLLYLGEKTDLKTGSPIPAAPKVKRRKK